MTNVSFSLHSHCISSLVVFFQSNDMVPASPGSMSPQNSLRQVPEDDDYVSDGGEVEREVVHQDMDDDDEGEEVEREVVR